MAQSWDVVIVGGRCAGASLAALLARRGLKVAIVEAAPRGTGKPMSTHYMQPPGLDVLDRLGIGQRVRSASPASRTVRFTMDGTSVDVPMPQGRSGHCIRRSSLDPWLQDAAEDSGAVLFDRHRVIDLVREGGRVCGVVARTDRKTVTLRAGLVVGADGVRSTVAQLVGAQEYLTVDSTRAGYWSYWAAPDVWEQPWDVSFEYLGEDIRYVFRCDDGQLLLAYVAPQATMRAWGNCFREKLAEAFAQSESTAPFCRAGSQLGKTVGLLESRYFYRQPVGPGWALVGDAGHYKDFVTGHGMTDALLDAQELEQTILDGRPEAFEAHWRQRDVRTLPLHFDALRMGRVGFNEPFMRWVTDRLVRRPDVAERLGLVFDRELSPEEFVPTSTMLGFIGQALARGRFNVLPGFLRTGKQLGEEAKEMAARRVLLQDAKARLAQASPAAGFATQQPSAGPATAAARSA